MAERITIRNYMVNLNTVITAAPYTKKLVTLQRRRSLLLPVADIRKTFSTSPEMAFACAVVCRVSLFPTFDTAANSWRSFFFGECFTADHARSFFTPRAVPSLVEVALRGAKLWGVSFFNAVRCVKPFGAMDTLLEYARSLSSGFTLRSFVPRNMMFLEHGETIAHKPVKARYYNQAVKNLADAKREAEAGMLKLDSETK